MLESPVRFLETLADWKITVVDLPTAYWHDVAAEMRALPGPLRLLVIGGEAAHAKALDNWRQIARGSNTPVTLLNTYGPTEATVVATARDLAMASSSGRSSGKSSGKHVATLGEPLRNVTCHLLGPEGHPVALGVEGEICLGGVGLARGYWKGPKRTAEKFGPDPWSRTSGQRLYRTGDRARRLGDGDLEFLGRLDLQVKIRGLRIELEEIESLLRSRPEVRDAVVCVDRGSERNPRLLAYLVAENAGREIEPETLRGWLRQSLPFYMVPAAIATLDSFPLSTSGKVDRRALPAIKEGPVLPKFAQVAPRTVTEESLAALWREILNVEQIGVFDAYFDLGGDSLLAVRLAARIERRFAVRLSLAELFADFTISALARMIDSKTDP